MLGSVICLSATPSAFAAGGVADNDAVDPPAESYATTVNKGKVASAAAFDAQKAAAKGGSVRVIVGLQSDFTPEGALSSAEVGSQRASIASQTDAVLAAVKGASHKVIHTYSTVPFVALELSANALDKLQASGKAASLQTDELAKPTLQDSTGPLLTEAQESWAVGRTGAGREVAILDTGVQKAHLFLQKAAGGSKVVSEACYSSLANCPGGVTESVAAGSGEPCTFASACNHGTHVAGIAAGRGTVRSGVAREANLVAIQIFSNFSGCSPCTATSDQIKGLERVNVLSATRPIVSANMSLGGGAVQTANCDADSRKPIIDTLRSKGIATAIASGNDGFTTGVSTPACISSAITVGSTTKSDTVSSFSNSSALVELLAPGSSITSSLLDPTDPKDAVASFSGTSMATPHVAGAWAVLKGISSAATVPTVLSALQSTGKPITDTRNSVVKPRIRVLAAGTRLADTNLWNYGTIISGTGVDVASGGIGSRNASGGGIVSLNGIPAGASLLQTKVVWTTIGGPDNSVVVNGVARTGNLVGAAQDTCWNINQLGPNRTYYAFVPVLGNGNHTVTGVGGVNGAQGQGASLITVYAKSGGGIGRVYQRIGASAGDTSGELFYAHVVDNGGATHVRRPALHVAVGDGQGFADNPLRFNNIAVTPNDFFYASNGNHWDDDRIPLSASLLPGGGVGRYITDTIGSDCVVLSAVTLSTEKTT